jgi:hypothetical protein
MATIIYIENGRTNIEYPRSYQKREINGKMFFEWKSFKGFGMMRVDASSIKKIID